MPTATICKFRPRTELRDLCAPSREDDERLLRVLKGFEDRGREVVVEGEAPIREDGDVGTDEVAGRTVQSATSSPNNFISEYLTRPLRTEDEARAQLNRPRIPQAKGLAQCIAECTGIDKAFRALIGGGQ